MENRSPRAIRTSIVDVHGHSTIFFGSDTWVGVEGNGVVDMSARDKDFEPLQFGVNANRTPDYFHIIPEVDPNAEVAAIGIIVVQLSQQTAEELFTITANQLKAFAGQPMPYRVKKVYKINTTEKFSIIW